MKLLTLLLILIISPAVNADSLLPPENPEQTLAYWKPYIVSAAKSNQVATAHRVFADLLKTWDGSRIEPVFHVVQSNSGPWAASLLDGTILLSESAIESCIKIAGQHYPDLLAFILAHELAHQRSDDLWRFKFFRLVGTQKPALQEKLLEGFVLNRDKILQIEKQEAQADQEGLTLMTLVGYDAGEIVSRHNFFKAWVENIWQQSCETESLSRKPVAVKNFQDISSICKQADVRAARAIAHLKKLSLDTNLYQLGVEAYVSGRYQQARKYFKAYGRIFPGNIILNSIGLTYLAEVMDIDSRLYELSGKDAPGFDYPVMLDLQPVFYQQKRGSNKSSIEKLRQQKSHLINQAVQVFERSIRLAPDYQPAYRHLVISYILDSNQPMANGVLLGKYQQRFGQDFDFQLLNALMLSHQQTSTAKTKAAEKLQELTKRVLDHPENYRDLQIFSAIKNTAAVLKLNSKDYLQSTEAEQFWKSVASRAKQFSDPSLFLMAVNVLNRNTSKILGESGVKLSKPQTIQVDENQLKKDVESFWFEGEKIYRIKNAKGDRVLLNDQGKVLSTHVVASNGKLEELGLFTKQQQIISRVYAKFGRPDRRVYLLNGQYIAYDKTGIALQLRNNRIIGWFYY